MWVSVVIPLYNKEDYVVRCVNSVLEQSFTDFELVIVDDGSTDNSAHLVSQFTDPRIILVHQGNTGPGAARNAGLLRSKGKYVAFLDADDYWNKDFLYVAVSRLESASQCDVFICGSTWQPGDQIRWPQLIEETNVSSGYWEIPDQISPVQTQRIVDLFVLGAVVLRREVPLKYNGFFDISHCTSGEDAYLWIQVMLNHAIFREFESLVTINIQGSNLGIGRGEIKPVPPSLLHPEKLYQTCPKDKTAILKRLLDHTAFLAIRRELYALRMVSAIRLYLKFPDLIKYRTNEFPPFPKALFVIPLRKLIKLILRGK